MKIPFESKMNEEMPPVLSRDGLFWFTVKWVFITLGATAYLITIPFRVLKMVVNK